MTLLAWLLFAFALARLAVSVANGIARPYLPRADAQQPVRREVSVLIPARDEAPRIGRLLDDLRTETGILEILVYDDRSADATADVVRHAAAKNPAVRLIPGGELPPGWLGKNHACHGLARQARGRYLLFLDADVRIRRQAVARALRAMQSSRAELLSVFPQQLMPDGGTRLAVPLMNWILLSLLPLAAVRRSPRPELCAANGQFLFFRTGTYRTMQPHSLFRRAPVEDMAIARAYKQAGYPVEIRLGRDDVACTMYRTLGEAVAGFSKNFFSFFSGSEVLCYAFALATTAGPAVVFLGAGLAAGLLYCTAVGMIRIAVSLVSRQSVAQNLLLAVAQQVVLWRIILSASVRKRRRMLLWKGRNIYTGA